MIPRLVLLTLLMALAPLAARPAPAQTAAQAAAATWLALVDGGNYYQSWAIASDPFRNAQSRTQWVARVGAAREPLGALRSRRLVSARPAHSLPGAPDGDYVVIEYASGFARQLTATEIVTSVKASDGHWRVSGYSIQ
jgi:hypothetical protein